MRRRLKTARPSVEPGGNSLWDLGRSGSEPRAAAEHPVIELIRRRALRRGVPDQPEDNDRLALAVEGGGLRGAVTGGMLLTLRELGLREVFDVVYGCSSGAANAAYFVAGHDASSLAVYFDHLRSRRFFDWRRLIRGPSIMDLDYVYRDVFVNRVPLDCQAVINSPVPLRILATSIEDGDTEVLGDLQTESDLFGALQASGHLPWIAGSRPFAYRGRSYWDGGLSDGYCLRTAQAEGATHVLLLRSRPMDHPLHEMNALEEEFVTRWLRRHSTARMAQLARLSNRPAYNGGDDLHQSERQWIGPPILRSFMCSIAVPPGSATGRLPLHRDNLVRAAKLGAESACAAFGIPNAIVEERPYDFDDHGHPVAFKLCVFDQEGAPLTVEHLRR